MNLASGYWQIAMSPDAKRKTVFVTNEGLFQFRVMPFGLCNSPATFERLMNRVLCGTPWSRCLVYLDDVISFGGTITEALVAAVLYDSPGDAGRGGDVYALPVISAEGSVHPSYRS